MKTEHQSQNLRKGRVSQPYQAYLVTIATRHRYPFFEDHGRARLVGRIMTDLESLGACHNWCYVVMPDHCHWMFSLKQRYSLDQTVRMLKSKTSRLAGLSLWQKGFHDHALRQETDLLPTARYVIANPLRAGLVERVGDYPYWNAAWL
ncbi:REP-associated tyrosine transposase [Alcanivorax sediminis]|uniref:Transposase n=1 Tax=Alcanivorax sediminis TaxID=2663008 RepID=A0A6N7LVV1_9GAMM|nr:transposase [Alcanivorax sediminis]MQX54393.1 transposase [Alcanivorax sediminis]